MVVIVFTGSWLEVRAHRETDVWGFGHHSRVGVNPLCQWDVL